MKSHGMSGTKLYKVWIDMKSRCQNPNDTGYKNWGGRGIKICNEWQNPNVFFEWAKNKWATGLQLDRIDNDKGYSPENCWFTTKSFQSVNKRPEARNSSGYRGINWDKQKNKWRARITINSKDKHLGFFENIYEANKARKKAVMEYQAMLAAAPEYQDHIPDVGKKDE